jgi:hypothetical protein
MHHLFDASAVRTALEVPGAVANLVATEPIPGAH